jgi:hypothetical protein
VILACLAVEDDIPLLAEWPVTHVRATGSPYGVCMNLFDEHNPSRGGGGILR